MFIMDYNTTPWQVELISRVGGLPTFLRDALIFAGFGEYSDAHYKTNASKELEIYKVLYCQFGLQLPIAFKIRIPYILL